MELWYPDYALFCVSTQYIVVDPGTSSPPYFSTVSLGVCYTFHCRSWNSSTNSKTKNITNYTHQEGNIMELLLTRHCLHGVMIYSMGVSANQHAVKSIIRHAVQMLLFIRRSSEKIFRHMYLIFVAFVRN